MYRRENDAGGGGEDNAVLVLFEGKMIKNALVVAVVLEERKLNFRVG